MENTEVAPPESLLSSAQGDMFPAPEGLSGTEIVPFSPDAFALTAPEEAPMGNDQIMGEMSEASQEEDTRAIEETQAALDELFANSEASEKFADPVLLSEGYTIVSQKVEGQECIVKEGKIYCRPSGIPVVSFATVSRVLDSTLSSSPEVNATSSEEKVSQEEVAVPTSWELVPPDTLRIEDMPQDVPQLTLDEEISDVASIEFDSPSIPQLENNPTTINEGSGGASE